MESQDKTACFQQLPQDSGTRPAIPGFDSSADENWNHEKTKSPASANIEANSVVTTGKGEAHGSDK